MPSVDCGFIGQPDMLARVGPTLAIRIGFDESYDPQRVVGEPDLPPSHIAALIDTGASDSCVDSDLARDLSLPIANRKDIAGLHASAMSNVHLAQLYIPGLNLVIDGQFFGARLASGGHQHLAIIGRDILRHLSMAYDGTTGSVTLESP